MEFRHQNERETALLLSGPEADLVSEALTVARGVAATLERRRLPVHPSTGYLDDLSTKFHRAVGETGEGTQHMLILDVDEVEVVRIGLGDAADLADSMSEVLGGASDFDASSEVVENLAAQRAGYTALAAQFQPAVRSTIGG